MKTIYFLFICLSLSFNATFAQKGGIFGDNGEFLWILEDSVLTVSGNGVMPRFSYSGCVIHSSPWYYQDDIKSIVIEYGISGLGYYAFYNCKNMRDVVFSRYGGVPSTVQDISNAFVDCTSLTDITIPENVTNISGAFKGCKNLTSAYIADNITNMTDAYGGCTGIANIDVSETHPLFYSQDGIVYSKDLSLIQYPAGKQGSFTIPQSQVNSIAGGAFDGCEGLIGIIIPNSVTDIECYAFVNCSELTDIVIPEEIKEIKNSTFSGCTKLTNITLPSELEKIRERAFESCTSLKQIIIPKNVVAISYHAFYHCTSLQKVEVQWETPLVIYNDLYESTMLMPCSPVRASSDDYDSPFYEVPVSSATLIVPDGTKELYQSADVWKEFGTIIEKSETAIENVADTPANPIGYYNLQGQQLTCEPEYGVYIIRYDDGTAKKTLKE
ncbi:MAG: leucine-rich repeat domain-containing protein [Dysgonamonadaceae bacterium]|jgi:hypothetical protein|nr:leucine-rich repeat domain-containing protein [Dysgonamonadaceae bacterium]